MAHRLPEVYDDPVHGKLELKRKWDGTGYIDVNKRVYAGGRVGFYAKTRLDLNEKKQTKVGGNFGTAEECAIFLATYLKEHPPVPKVPGGSKMRRPFAYLLHALTAVL